MEAFRTCEVAAPRESQLTGVGFSGVACKCLEYFPFASLLPSQGTPVESHTPY